MRIEKCKVIYFSPTNTTKKIVYSITSGLEAEYVEFMNLNKHNKTKDDKILIKSDIVIIAAPVYGGRIAKEAQRIFENIDGRGCLAVLVVTYGNISPGIALEQLYDICARKGLKVIGMGTFIGEHSFCTDKVQVGYKRPNEEDLNYAKEFGAKIRDKIIKAKNKDSIEVCERPNLLKRCISRGVNIIYKAIPQKSGNMVTKLPVIDKEKCNRCGICVMNCPMNAISIDDNLSIDKDKCIRCFRCVKECPKNARKIEYKFNPIFAQVFRFMGRKDSKIKVKI